MSQLGPYLVHPAADEFPMLEDDELKALADSIRHDGLQHPIIVNHDDTILIDGRNRWRACEIAGADPVTERLGPTWTDKQIIDYIVDANIKRRHLNPGQRAMIGAGLLPHYAAAAKAEQQRAGGTRWKTGPDQQEALVADRPQANASERKAREQAAAAVGAAGRTVGRADAVRRDAPDLAEKVRNGEMFLDAADKQRRERINRQNTVELVPPGPKPHRADPVLLTLHTNDGTEVKYPMPQGKSKFNETTGPGISWAAWSWNPVTGCLHGCSYCYAREIATNDRFASAYPVGFTPLFHHERLDAPRNTTIPAAYHNDDHQSCNDGDCRVCAYRRVFVCSMADLYGRWVPDEWIERVHGAMLDSPRWQYITLTKFPERYPGLQMPDGAWIGTSVDEQKRVNKAERVFAELPSGVVKWLSLEPLREPLEFNDLSVFDWVVIGAQTETYQPDGVVPAFAPPIEWVSRLIMQALDSGCKVHTKPNLFGGAPGMRPLNQYPQS